MRYYELIFKEEATEAGIIKPKKPMTPVQARREAERKTKVQKRIADVKTSSSDKINDLTSELFSTSRR